MSRILFVIGIFFITAAAIDTRAQAVKQYQDMSRAERLQFVGEQARRIARELSGNEYQFTSAFEVDIQKAVTNYAERIGGKHPNKSDLQLVMDRGKDNATLINAAFRARNMSPMFGLYISWIESEFKNIDTPTPMGSVGMFQFIPETGQRFGLTKEDLMDVSKSADAAARYLNQNIEFFKQDAMKEALALLAYNRGEGKTARDLKILINDQNKQCSICALTADRSKLDETFKNESVFYVPRFFAAAIIGENPQTFGLKNQPLSSY